MNLIQPQTDENEGNIGVRNIQNIKSLLIQNRDDLFLIVLSGYKILIEIKSTYRYRYSSASRCMPNHNFVLRHQLIFYDYPLLF